MNVRRLVFWSVLVGSLAVFGCGDGGTGSGGTGGSGGTAGSGGTGGSGGTAGSGGTGGSGGFAVTPGLWTSSPRATSVCLFVNDDGTALLADPSCSQSGFGLVSNAFEFRSNRQDGICAFGYPIDGEQPQEVPIVNNQFEIETTRGDITVKFSGTFTGTDAVSGVASSTMNCPADEPWGAAPGCCSQCAYCQ